MTATADPLASIEPDIADELASYALESQEQACVLWPDISPLPSLLPEVPEMPPEIIPGSFRNLVVDISERMQIPLSIPAVSIIAALSSVVGRSIAIYPKMYDDWIVIPNLWGYVAARSGMLKTPAINEATKPLGVLAQDARKQYEISVAQNEADAIIAEARINAVKAQIIKAAKDKNEAELKILKDELLKIQHEAEIQKPIERRYRVNDATIEKLLEILTENPRGIFAYRDELPGWLRSMDKIGREMDRAFYLESWNGNGPYTTDRIGRGTVHVDGLCLSVFGGIQPSRLAAYISDALDGNIDDDGLLQRFQLAVYPEPPKTWKLIDRAPDMAARDRAFKVFDVLNVYDPMALGIPVSSEIPAIRFHKEAQELFNEWLTKLQQRMLQGEGSPAYESHLSKYKKLMPALALLFHLAEWAENQVQGNLSAIPAVSLQAAKLSAAWVDYLELHARKIYAGALNPDLQAAHLLLQKIKHGKIKNGTTIRDIYRSQWNGLQKKERVTEGLLLLSEGGYLRLASVKGKEGRPHSDYIYLNPKLGSKSNAV